MLFKSSTFHGLCSHRKLFAAEALNDELLTKNQSLEKDVEQLQGAADSQPSTTLRRKC